VAETLGLPATRDIEWLSNDELDELKEAVTGGDTARRRSLLALAATRRLRGEDWPHEGWRADVEAGRPTRIPRGPMIQGAER
jgi:hypothetical protein